MRQEFPTRAAAQAFADAVNLKARVDKVLTAPERADLKAYRRG